MEARGKNQLIFNFFSEFTIFLFGEEEVMVNKLWNRGLDLLGIRLSPLSSSTGILLESFSSSSCPFPKQQTDSLSWEPPPTRMHLFFLKCDIVYYINQTWAPCDFVQYFLQIVNLSLHKACPTSNSYFDNVYYKQFDSG